MAAPQTMMIDSVKYVREDSVKVSCDSGPKDLRIVVLPRAWNIIGEYSEKDGKVTVANASIIRIWGTTKGLGQLAKDGPTKNTVLDPTYGDVSVLESNILFTIKCEQKLWK